jgi:predicted esterase
LRQFYFVFLYCLVTWSAFAADDMPDMGDEALSEEGVENGNGSAQAGSKGSMMRQISPVTGYQPLSVAGQNIDAAYMEERLGERYGAIVFFHGQGEAFESQGVITPLRHSLAEHGWATLTLSFNLPFESNVMLSASMEEKEASSADGVSDSEEQDEGDFDGQATKGANVDDKGVKTDLPPIPNLERIEAALAMLQAKGIERVIFLGHGKGAELAIELLDSQTLPVAGLILVGMSEIEVDDDFKGLEIPVLEVYGELGLLGVDMAVNQRRAIMKRVAKTNYDVRRVLGANHVFYGLEPMLLLTVRSWLKATFVQQGYQ